MEREHAHPEACRREDRGRCLRVCARFWDECLRSLDVYGVMRKQHVRTGIVGGPNVFNGRIECNEDAFNLGLWIPYRKTHMVPNPQRRRGETSRRDELQAL